VNVAGEEMLMGWKGAMRSMGAANRRASLAAERRRKAVAKIGSIANSAVAALDAEVEKEIKRIERYEEKISTQPAKTLQLAYDPTARWRSLPFKEQTGDLTYTVEYIPPSIDDAAFEPATVVIGGVHLTPCALSVSQYFTAVAFEATADPEGGGRMLKLTFPKSPESSRIALASPTGEMFTPLDSTLDGRIFASSTRVGVVTFEPFSSGLNDFDILLEAPPAKKGANSETIRIRVTAPTLQADIAKCLEQPSILEEMTKKFRTTQGEFNTRVAKASAAASKRASKGCLVVFTMGLGTVLLFAALALQALGN
jgi:hypothetical protein